MKKIILASLLTAAAGAGWAQSSSVTIYGLIDLSVTKANNGTSRPANTGEGNLGQWNLQNGANSRLGFRGREEIGGGTYARFDLQHRLNADTGTLSATNVFWNGRSIVAVGGPWGEIYAGREEAPAYQVALAGEPSIALAYVSRFDVYYLFANHTSGTAAVDGNGFRHSNTVGLRSANLSGFVGEAAVSGGEGGRKRIVGVSGQYKSGPIYLGAAYDGTGGDDRLWVITAGYDFKVVRPTLTYANSRGGNGAIFASGGTVSTPNVGVAGALYAAHTLAGVLHVPLSTGRVFVGAARLDPKGDANNSTKFVAGYEYLLSKRTMLYTTAGTAKMDDRAVVGVNRPYSRASAFDVGMRHTF